LPRCSTARSGCSTGDREESFLRDGQLARSISIFLKLYVVAFTSFMVIDLLWLGVIARSFYRSELGHLMRAEVNWAAAVAIYLVFVLGIVGLAA
jgi:hypothetical protein